MVCSICETVSAGRASGASGLYAQHFRAEPSEPRSKERSLSPGGPDPPVRAARRHRTQVLRSVQLTTREASGAHHQHVPIGPVG